ncbi:MAG: ATP-binding protein [Mariprofundales bacterium]
MISRDPPQTQVPPLRRYSIIAAASYLLLDALIGGFIDHISFTHELLSLDDPQEWWMRIITMGIVIFFGHYAQQRLQQQVMLNQQLNIANENVNLLFDSTAEGIFFIDGDEHCQRANATFINMVGFSLEELNSGDLHQLLDPRLSEESPIAKEECALCQLNPEQHETVHFPLLFLSTKQGETLAVECWAHPVHTTDKFHGHLLSAINIGERVKAQAKRDQLLLDLEKERCTLEARNEELQRFAYVASHDLQEPLRMVSSFVQLLSRRYGAQLDDGAREFIGYAVDGTARMQTMINDLLTYSRIGSQAKPLAAMLLRPLIDDAISNLQLAISDSHAEITIDDIEVVIMADDSQLTRLFQNLIGNALKFQPPEQQPRITISITTTDDHHTIAIQDNGIGIADAYRSKVFEVFKRLHNREQYPGSGIGLAVCKRIVERHHGDLTIADTNTANIANHTEKSKGSTFIITLPRIAAI